MNRRQLGALLALLATSAGCDPWRHGPIHFERAAPGMPRLARKDPASVTIHFITRPASSYRVIGTLRTESRNPEALRKAAAARGCDAVIVQVPPRFFPNPRGCADFETPLLEAACIVLEPSGAQ